ncbi:MAG TPA: long-chain fatty acid--CoA ligase [Burkholderiaceae bacterium]|nr:long-chain fatty acid--CoA ligase [Burkholderiaceae bacterium]
MEPGSPFHLDLISLEEADTLAGLFERRCEHSPDGEAYRQFDPASGAWQGCSWREMRERVSQWRGALAREGLPPGERVAVMLKNSIEWVCFDQAAQSLGLVVVPLYPTDNPENIAYILGDCGARVLLLANLPRWLDLAPHQSRFPGLARVLCCEAAPGARPTGGEATVSEVQDWLRQPPGTLAPLAANPMGLATIVYTSGTTGPPKGVMLSHRNILSNVDAVLRLVQVFREDLFLSFLPLSHTLERTVGYYLPMMTGSTVAFARSVQDLAQDLRTVRPTALVSVPRVYERIYARLQQELEARGAPAKALFEWAEDIGWRRFEAAQHRGRDAGLVADMMWPALRHLVADKILAHLGGRLRIAVSGGAPISARLMHSFIGLGLPLLQGYGLTEASPIVTANTLEDNVPASVGVPVPGVDVRLGEQGELLVRGPNVMMGYWNDPQKTRDAFTADGWLRTGDLARIDADGHVHITGRLKEILVTSTGEKVPPADLELAIAEDPLFEQVMVLGEGRPFVSALVVVNRDAWRALAAELDLDENDATAVRSVAARAALVRRAGERLGGFPVYARVRDLWPTLSPWTVDNGLITPTMKLKRRELERRFAAEIEQLYAANHAHA